MFQKEKTLATLVSEGKILALDIGTKRVGYAVSDVDQTMVFPRETLNLIPQIKFIEKLACIIKEEGICKIVVGLPLDIENEESDFAKKIRKFGEKLAVDLAVPVFYVDETGSTQEALAKIPFRRDRRAKGAADAIAAQIILERYLEGICAHL